MIFNISKVSRICVFAYTSAIEDIDFLLYTNSKGEMHFKYQDEVADNIPLPDLTKMQEAEFFQYSLVYDFEYLSIHALLELQNKMLEVYDELIKSSGMISIEVNIQEDA